MSDQKVNFQHDGRELTAYVDLLPDAENIHDMILEEITECSDSETGEEIKVTPGIRAQVIFALREKMNVPDSENLLPKVRIFDKKQATKHRHSA